MINGIEIGRSDVLHTCSSSPYILPDDRHASRLGQTPTTIAKWVLIRCFNGPLPLLINQRRILWILHRLSVRWLARGGSHDPRVARVVVINDVRSPLIPIVRILDAIDCELLAERDIMATDYKFEGWMGLNPQAADGQMVWQEYEPKTWEETDIDIKISHCGICGSDLHTLRSGWVCVPLLQHLTSNPPPTAIYTPPRKNPC